MQDDEYIAIHMFADVSCWQYIAIIYNIAIIAIYLFGA
jgi:hypothetical protein